MELLYATNSKHPKKVVINSALVNDPFNRYKMTQLVLEVNKGRTFFSNLDLIANELKVPPGYILHYFSVMLGARSDVKKNTLSGSFAPDRISFLVENFIRGLVLCSACELPELDYENKIGKVIISCRSCGYVEKLDARDLPETLKKYVINHP